MKRIVPLIIIAVLLGNSLVAQPFTAVTASQDSICSGSVDTLHMLDTLRNGPFHYHWSPASGLSDSTAQSPTIQPTVTTTYCATASDATGDTVSACITIYVDPLHIDSFTQLDSVPPYEIIVDPSGGWGTLSFNWSNGSSTMLTYVDSGIVSVTINDGHCAVTGSDTIHLGPFTVVATSTHGGTLCTGTTDGLNAMAYWGTGPYTYHWSPATGGLSDSIIANPTIHPTVTTTYCVTVTDSTGATAASCITIMVDQLHIDSFTQLGILPPYPITVDISGEIGIPAFAWSNGSSTMLTYGDSGVLFVTVRDSNCSVTGSYTVRGTSTASLQYDSTIINTPWYYCVLADSADTAGLLGIRQPFHGIISKTYVGNQVCLVYMPNNNFLGLDTFTIQTCTATGCDSIVIVMNVYSRCYECVWPGDANEDGIVNNADLLSIGLAYGSTGPPRPNATLNWVGQPAPYWLDSLADSVNYKFIDCNGNGTIDGNDTVAILLNYTQTHTRGTGSYSPQTGEPLLMPVANKDTVTNGDTVVVQFFLGDSSLPVNSAYGLAFTLNYDPLVVDSSKTRVHFGNSWLGSAGNKITIAKNFEATGQLECGYTRINHFTRSGNGQFGWALFVITTDNINGLIAANNDYVARFYVGDITMVDSAGNILTVGGGNDSVVITADPAAIQRVTNIASQVHIYPNPASNLVEIKSPNAPIEQVKIMDIIGNEVLEISGRISGGTTLSRPTTIGTNQEIDVSKLSPGIYAIEVLTPVGIAEQKLVIAR